MAPLTIDELQPNNGAQTIKLRVARLWDCIQIMSGTRLGIAFVGIDYRGNGVHVQIFEAHADLFRDRLAEGNIYQLTNFIVAPPQIAEVSVQSRYIIFFHQDTDIQEGSDPSGIYRRYFFDFSGENNLRDDDKWETYLTDVIGIIKSITRTTYLLRTAGNTVGKKDIKIMTLRGRVLDVTLWEPVYDALNIPAIVATRPRPAVLFSGLKVRNYYSGISLSSTAATKIYVDLEIPETTQVQDMYRRMGEANGIEGNHN